MRKVNRRLTTQCICSFLLATFCNVACKKSVEVDAPVTSLTDQSVFNSDATAISVVTGIYTKLSTGSFASGGTSGISFLAGLSADELTLWGGVSYLQYIAYYSNALNPSTTPSYGSELWNSIYPLIFICNSALEGISISNSLTPAVREQLIGEAKFMRAFFYFYLVNFYGDVPLVLTSNYNVNKSLARSPVNSVYQQIISDLQDAVHHLSANYLGATLLATTTERVRPTKWAAFALLAKTYLYTGDWQNAEIESDSVIGNSQFALTSLSQVFLRNSKEAIWQLQPVLAGYTNTLDAFLFILPATGPSSSFPVYLSNSLLSSFEPKDSRRVNWVDSVAVAGNMYYFPFKYKANVTNAVVSEYPMVMRIAEQYLIRAEARAEQGNVSGAQADLNSVRGRANLPPTRASSVSDLLNAIWHERQVELFTEWGNRWLDLKRTNEIDSVMNSATLQKGGVWNPYKKLYPLPLKDVVDDPNLTQNVGYSN